MQKSDFRATTESVAEPIANGLAIGKANIKVAHNARHLTLLTVKSAVAEDEQAVVALWRACDLVASYNDPVADFRFAKAGPCSDVLVAVDDAGEVAGSVMVGHDGHRGWLYYVAARPTSRSKGVGRRMVQAAENWLRQTGESESAAPSSRNKHQGGELLRAPRFRGNPARSHEQMAGENLVGR
jgi:GNAT superfamily N-acetyltransferase